MVLIVCHTEHFSLATGTQTGHWKYVLLFVNASVVAERERPVQSGVFNGTPEIDYLEATREEPRDVDRRKMAVYVCDGRPGRLIDVDLRDGLALPFHDLLVVCLSVPKG